MLCKLWKVFVRRLAVGGLLCLFAAGLSQSAQAHTLDDMMGDHAVQHMTHVSYSPVGNIHVDEAENSYPVGDYYDHVLIVEFAGEYQIRLREGEFIDLNEKANLAELARLAELGEWERAYSVDETFIDDMRREAEAIKGKPMPDLNNYYHFNLPDGWKLDEALAHLATSPFLVYIEPIPIPYPPQAIPNYTDSDPSLFWYQRYLNPAPDGIDARWAWMGAGGMGEDVRICNIERGFNSSHVDLPPLTVLGHPYFGTEEEHGTAVLGILGGRENDFGVTGIIPRAKYYFAHVGPTNADNDAHQTHIHDAVFRCLAALNFGDIILIEVQIPGPKDGWVAVDWFKPFYDAVKIASATVLVVEPAGNGGEWLDDPVYMLESDHNPFVLSSRSGALIVGAGNSPYLADVRERRATSNHGTIVRMQGWGDNIVAPGFGDLHPGGSPPDPMLRNEFYTRFKNTSGAGPIVVGAAAAIQGVHKAAFGYPLPPQGLEELLRETGTPQEGVDIIGPLPNIRAAVEKIFADHNVGLTPAAPVLSPGGGAHDDWPMHIHFNYGDPSQHKLNTVIRFTLDGSEPGFEHGWQVVPENDPAMLMNFGITMKAKAFQYDSATKRWFPSATTTETYIGGTPVVETPNIALPHSGLQFVSPMTVTLTTSTPDAVIRYRTDGKNISWYYPGTIYNGPFTLGPGEYSLVVRAYKDGYYGSQMAKQSNLTVIAPQLHIPSISPFGGSFWGGAEVAMSHSVSGAEIRYTTDGSNVQPDSMLYVEPLWLTKSVKLRARAYLDGYQSSSTISADFDITPAPAVPEFEPVGGSYSGSVLVQIGGAKGATTVRYTTNGAEPKYFSPEYSAPFTLGVGQHTVKAKAFNLEGSLESPTAIATYTVFDPNPDKVVAPIFDPPGGIHTGAVTVTMSSATEGATIRYTLSPLEPEDQWLIYSRPVVFMPHEDGYVLRAKAYKRHMSNSDLTQASYSVFAPQGTVEPPWITPPSGSYTDTIRVTLNLTQTTPFEEALIYYTTDGATPAVRPNMPGATSSMTFDLSRPAQVKAIGAQRGYDNSPVVEAKYSFYCAMPTMTAGGIYTESVAVEINTLTPNAVIHYTTDGSEPTQRSPQYTRPILLDEVGRIAVRARCFRRDFAPSRIVQQLYWLHEAPPPSLSRQPTDQIVPPGAPAVFEAELAGGDPASAQYQWQRNGLNLIGANEPRLEIPTVRQGYAGVYRLLVTTKGGEVLSREALLSLEDAPISGLVAVSNSPTFLGDVTNFFTSVSGGTGVTYAWDFGDGRVPTGRGSGPIPSHTYAALGTYTAVVTAMNDVSQETTTISVKVTDTPAPITDLAASNSGPTELGQSTRFSATVSGGTSVNYSWDFGDGTTGSGPIPSHVYAQTGVYTAMVTASNSNEGTAQAATVVTVGQVSQPIEGLAAGSSPTQLGEPTLFNAGVENGTNVSFIWDFGDGATGSGPSPSHTYGTPGVYTVQVTAANDLGSLVATIVATVLDGDAPIQTLSVSATTPTELGEATFFTASSDGSGVTYAWDFDDGETSSGASVSHIYTEAGMYTVRVTARNEMSERSESAQVVVQVTPKAIEAVELVVPEELLAGRSASFQASAGVGSNVIYLWDFGDGNIGTGTAVNHRFAEPGTYVLRLTARNDLGEITIERTVTVAGMTISERESTPGIYLPMIER